MNPFQNIYAPHLNFFLMTSPHDCHTTTDVKPEMIPGQASKPEMKFHMINMIYAALSIRTHTENTTFLCKDDRKLTKHMGLDIFYYRFEIPLCHIPPLRSFFTLDIIE